MENQTQQEAEITKTIPVIIAAMTREELLALDSPEFHAFCDLLDANQVHDLLKRYGDKREEWRPFGKNGKTIRSLVSDSMKLVPRLAFKPDFKLIKDFFSPNSLTQQGVWKALNKDGWCLLIVDGVSLYHSTIRDNLVSTLGAIKRNERVAVAVLSPFDATQHIINRTLMDIIGSQCKPINYRYITDLDPKVDFLTGDTIRLYRWLRVNLERTKAEIREEERQLNPDKRNWLQSEQRSAPGYGSVV